MNDSEKAWRRLVAAARKAPRAGDESAPFGFSTRVAALAFEERRSGPSPFARLSLRAAWIACLLALAAVGANYSAIAGALGDEPAAGGDDPVDEVVSLGS